MFSFWKKNKDTSEKKSGDNVESSTAKADNAAELKQQVAIWEEKLGAAQGADKINCLNMLGETYFKLNEIDQAIKYYEQSLASHAALGKAYTDLLKLYNMKRKDAAQAGDDAQIQIYLEKIDGLMKLTKDTIRSV